MGNGASVGAEEQGEEGITNHVKDLDEPVKGELVSKPSKEKSRNQSGESAEDTPLAAKKVVRKENSSNNPIVSAKAARIDLSDQDIERAKTVLEPPVQPKSKSSMVESMTNREDEEEDDGLAHLEPKDILFQFIPFYGQGDTSTDSIVRATLSGLSVEEIDSRDEFGNTLLLLACQCRCEDLARIMVNKGADCNAVNTSGASCLHFACYRDSASKLIAKLLLKNGANPDVAERTYGCTPLHYCAGLGDIDFLKLLLTHGATIDIRDSYNYTCADYAREAGLTEVAVFLEDKIQKAKTAQHLKFTRANSTARSGLNLGPPGASKTNYGPDWTGYLDPASGATYFVNSKTGECLWEYDLRNRVEQEQTAGGKSRTGSLDGAKGVSALGLSIDTSEPVLELKKTISFMNSPSSNILRRASGDEATAQAPPIGLDSFAVQNLINETKSKLETQFEEEKAGFRANLSEKDGLISKLESEIDLLRKEKSSIEVIYDMKIYLLNIA